MLQRRNPSSIAAPLGRYTHGVEAPAGARILFVSGQVGIGPDGSLAEGPAGQIERAFLNVKAVLEDNGYSQEDLIKTVTYMTRREDLALLRDVRERVFPLKGAAGDPAATLIFVAGLADPEWMIEVEAVAAKA